jgi:hypothetical protein
VSDFVAIAMDLPNDVTPPEATYDATCCIALWTSPPTIWTEALVIAEANSVNIARAASRAITAAEVAASK